MQRYKVVVVCCTADETDVHTIRVNGWGESEAEYNARRKIQKFHRHEYEKICWATPNACLLTLNRSATWCGTASALA